jgi:hypothetical protein
MRIQTVSKKYITVRHNRDNIYWKIHKIRCERESKPSEIHAQLQARREQRDRTGVKKQGCDVGVTVIS